MDLDAKILKTGKVNLNMKFLHIFNSIFSMLTKKKCKFMRTGRNLEPSFRYIFFLKIEIILELKTLLLVELFQTPQSLGY